MATLDEFAEVAVATQRGQEKRNPTSSVVEHNILLNFLQDKKQVKTDQKGGTTIERTVVLNENQTVQNFVGLQALNVGASNIMNQAKMGWSQKAMFVVASGREVNINMGDNELFDFVNTKLDNARDTAANRMAVEIYGDGSLIESIAGIASFVQPGGAGVYGGIDATLYPRWRNQVVTLGASPTKEDLEKGYSEAFKKASDGIDTPDLGVASIAHFTLLEAWINEKTRFNVGPGTGYMNKSKAGMGFDTLAYKNGMTVAWDVNSQFLSGANRTFFLCTKHIDLVEHPSAKWTFDQGQRPINQDATIMMATWMGGMITKKRRCHAFIGT
jgi:hypothetical protein